VPITAKLSRKFYEKFGDDVTNELVDWLNQVDLSYRNELRQLNDLNYARFEAKLDAKIEQLVSRREFEERFAQLRTDMAGLRADLIKWMFLFWAGSTATMVGLAFTISRFVRP
jgi:hypothetical protein